MSMKFKRTTILMSRLGIVILIVGSALFLHYTRVTQPLENLIIKISQPLQIPFYSFSKKITKKAPRQTLSSADQKKLEDQVQNLIIENTHLRTLVAETDLLEEQVEFLRESSLRAVPAKVVSRTSEGFSQSIVINRGARHGIERDLPAIVNKGVLIGTVGEVADYTSEVILLTSNKSVIGAIIQNEQQSPGIIQGEYNLSLKMNFIPQFDSINIGDAVLTSGQDNKIPRGLVIGLIQNVISEQGQVFQQAIIEPFMQRAADISIVSVVIP